jgi:hypothetical protein
LIFFFFPLRLGVLHLVSLGLLELFRVDINHDAQRILDETFGV